MKMGGDRITPGAARLVYLDGDAFNKATAFNSNMPVRYKEDYNDDGADEQIATTRLGDKGQSIVVVDFTASDAAEQKTAEALYEKLETAKSIVGELKQIISGGEADKATVADALVQLPKAELALAGAQMAYDGFVKKPYLSKQLETVGQAGGDQPASPYFDLDGDPATVEWVYAVYSEPAQGGGFEVKKMAFVVEPKAQQATAEKN